ncbi:MAG: hypothetical protein R2708_21000 [Vicinamibacterales bacterium]
MGERSRCAARRAERGQDALGGLGAHVVLAAGYPAHGGQQLRRRLILHDVAERPGLQRVVGVQPLVVAREHQDAQARVPADQGRDEIETALGAQGEIDDHDVRRGARHGRQGLVD